MLSKGLILKIVLVYLRVCDSEKEDVTEHELKGNLFDSTNLGEEDFKAVMERAVELNLIERDCGKIKITESGITQSEEKLELLNNLFELLNNLFE